MIEKEKKGSDLYLVREAAFIVLSKILHACHLVHRESIELPTLQMLSYPHTTTTTNYFCAIQLGTFACSHHFFFSFGPSFTFLLLPTLIFLWTLLMDPGPSFIQIWTLFKLDFIYRYIGKERMSLDFKFINIPITIIR